MLRISSILLLLIGLEHITGSLAGLIACGSAMDAPTYGTVNCTNDNLIGSVCTFTCDDGYIMEGNDQSKCVLDPFDRYIGVWTNDAPKCIPDPTPDSVTCSWSALELVDGSTSCTNDNFIGSVCVFTCDEGFRMEGNGQTKCVLDPFDKSIGIWTNTATVCIRDRIIIEYTCQPAMDAPTDGSVSCTNGNNYGSVCTFACDDGHIMEGNAQSECVPDPLEEFDGIWTNNAPVCLPDPIIIEYTCLPAMDAPAHGSVSCTNDNFIGSVCTFTCDDGYVMMEGEPQSKCQAGETGTHWTSNAPVCIRDGIIDAVTCHPAMDAPTDGSVNCTDSNNIGSVCTFTCDERTYMAGEPKSECQKDETGVNWTYGAPLCVALTITCEPVFDALAHGSVSCTDGNFIGSVCSFACDVGYELEGDDKTSCFVADFDVVYWTNRAPVCTPRTCQPAFDAPTDGSVSCTSGNFYGSVCTFTCDEQTYMVGQPQSKCQVDETGIHWTNDAPQCQPLIGAVTCDPAFEAPANGSVSCTHDNFAGSVCTFVCDEGYGMEGHGQSQCVNDVYLLGYWTNKAPRCVYLKPLLTCEPAFEAPAHGSVSCTDSNNIGSVCTFACDAGYKLEGDDQSSCAQGYVTGVWTNNAPVCVAVDIDTDMMVCEPAYEAPNYGSVNCTDANNLGSQCTFACEDGYKLIGEHQSTCILRGEVVQWGNSSPHYCIPEDVDPATIVCEPAFDAPTDGSVSCTKGNFYGSVCTFTCDDQTMMVGQPQSKCQVDFTGIHWTNDAPVCEPFLGAVTCDPALDAPRGGSVSCTHDNFAGSICTFTCYDGYELKGSDQSECVKVDILSGNWTNNAPICQEPPYSVSCWPAFEELTDGSVSCTDVNFVGSVCTFTCDEGYIIEGIGQSECVSDPVDKFGGIWTNNAPVCIPDSIIDTVTCHPAMDAPTDGSVSCTNDNFIGSICTFECDEGYDLVGDWQSECARVDYVTGNWTNFAPKCIKYQCQPALEAPVHGSISCSDQNLLWSVCNFTCNDGYVMKGERQSTCWPVNELKKDYEEWTSPAPVCLGGPQIPCNHAFVPNSDGINYIQSPGYPHGYANNMNCSWYFDGRGSGKNISVTFIDGKLEKGYDFILINPRGKASQRKLTGVVTGEAVSSPDGLLVLDMITDGSVTYRGFKASYEFQPIPCSVPHKIPNGDLLCSHGSAQGSECLFTCDPGFMLVGSNTSTCSLEAHWSHPFPSCIAVQCPHLPTKIPHGLIKCSKGNLFGSVCKFYCLRRGKYVRVGEADCIQDDEGVAMWTTDVPVCTPEVPPYMDAFMEKLMRRWGKPKE